MDLSNLHNRPPVPTAKELKAAKRRSSAQDSRQGASGHGVATCCDACRESCCMGKVETDSVNVGSPLTGNLKDWITQSFLLAKTEVVGNLIVGLQWVKKLRFVRFISVAAVYRKI